VLRAQGDQSLTHRNAVERTSMTTSLWASTRDRDATDMHERYGPLLDTLMKNNMSPSGVCSIEHPQEKQRFAGHQQQEPEAFTRQQQWRLNAWQQAVANSPGQKPPPPPWNMPTGGQMRPPGGGMPGPMAGPPPWMQPPGPGRRRS